MRNHERGLEELALNLALDLEPHDPPKGMGDRLFARIEAGSAPSPSPAVQTGKTSPIGIWTKVASVASVILLVLYGTALYENYLLKQKIAKPTKHDKIVMTNPFGEVVRTFHLVSPNGTARGKALVVDGVYHTRIVIFAKGITKDNPSDVVQVWVSENGKVRTAGATEPLEDGSVNFSSFVSEKIDGVSITEEKTYNTSPKGKLLLASSRGPQPSGGTRTINVDNKGTDIARGTDKHGQSNPVPTTVVRREEPTRNDEGNTPPQGNHSGNDIGGGSGGYPGNGTTGNHSGNSREKNGNHPDNNNDNNRGIADNSGHNSGQNANPPEPQNPPNSPNQPNPPKTPTRDNYVIELGLLPGMNGGHALELKLIKARGGNIVDVNNSIISIKVNKP